jgi:hypothetical protein
MLVASEESIKQIGMVERRVLCRCDTLVATAERECSS